MYYNGITINISKEQILFGDIEQGIEMKDTTLKNYDAGISLQTT
jgi:hypothetical protein